MLAEVSELRISRERRRERGRRKCHFVSGKEGEGNVTLYPCLSSSIFVYFVVTEVLFLEYMYSFIAIKGIL